MASQPAFCEPGPGATASAPLRLQLLAQPVLSGDSFSYTGWGDPWVIQVGSKYVMYMGQNQPRNGREDTVAPLRATSPDGVHWQVDQRPLLNPGKRTADFDYLKVETPRVAVLNGLYHMYYTGVAQNDSDLAIGHAMSHDGRLWRKTSIHRPIISSSHDFGDDDLARMVGEPSPLVVDGVLQLYFVLVEARTSAPVPSDAPAKMSIWRATALDDWGTSFGAPVKVLEQSALYPMSQGYEGYSTPAAVLYNDQVHLFYSVYQYAPGSANPHQHVAIHHAVSTDGVTCWQEDPGPLIRRGDAPWASQEVYSPTIVVHGSDLGVWFSAHNIDWDNPSPDARMSIGLLGPPPTIP